MQGNAFLYSTDMFNDICVEIINSAVSESFEHYTVVNRVEGLFVVDEDEGFVLLHTFHDDELAVTGT